jgi:hypothetical protein
LVSICSKARGIDDVSSAVRRRPGLIANVTQVIKSVSGNADSQFGGWRGLNRPRNRDKENDAQIQNAFWQCLDKVRKDIRDGHRGNSLILQKHLAN